MTLSTKRKQDRWALYDYCLSSSLACWKPIYIFPRPQQIFGKAVAQDPVAQEDWASIQMSNFSLLLQVAICTDPI